VSLDGYGAPRRARKRRAAGCADGGDRGGRRRGGRAAHRDRVSSRQSGRRCQPGQHHRLPARQRERRDRQRIRPWPEAVPARRADVQLRSRTRGTDPGARGRIICQLLANRHSTRASPAGDVLRAVHDSGAGVVSARERHLRAPPGERSARPAGCANARTRPDSSTGVPPDPKASAAHPGPADRHAPPGKADGADDPGGRPDEREAPSYIGAGWQADRAAGRTVDLSTYAGSASSAGPRAGRRADDDIDPAAAHAERLGIVVSGRPFNPAVAGGLWDYGRRRGGRLDRPGAGAPTTIVATSTASGLARAGRAASPRRFLARWDRSAADSADRRAAWPALRPRGLPRRPASLESAFSRSWRASARVASACKRLRSVPGGRAALGAATNSHTTSRSTSRTATS
jgi:hypothetical protein